MSFGLPRARDLDPGTILIDDRGLPPLPDDLLTHPTGGWLDPRAWFERPQHPFEIEIGSGKGTFLLQQGAVDADVNFLGIEWERAFAVYAADRLRRRGLLNVRMLCADATSFVRWRCGDGLARVIHLYFSDPWPKTKHHKNRVVQHGFLEQAWRVLPPGGELRVVTDHAELWAWDEAHFEPWTAAGGAAADGGGSVPNWIRARLAPGVAPFARVAFAPPDWVGEGELVGTNYERKMVAPGATAFACTLVRQG